MNERGGVKLETRITVGGIIQLVLTLIAFAVGFGMLKTEVTQSQVNYAAMQREIKELRMDFNNHVQKSFHNGTEQRFTDIDKQLDRLNYTMEKVRSQLEARGKIYGR